MPREKSEISIDLRPIAGMGVNLDQYFGLWMVEHDKFGAMVDQVGAMDLLSHVRQSREDLAASIYAGDSPDGGDQAPTVRNIGSNGDSVVSVIDISGTMTKQGSSLSSAGSTVMIRRAVRQAAADSSITGIVLRIDSPGGTVSGTADLAAEVAAAAKKKPVHAFAEDLAASAAYWVGSQANFLYANTGTAMIGSIGTYAVLYDYSGMAAKDGVKAILVKAGKYKGAGAPGVKISDEQIAQFQELIDKTQEHFTAGVAAGRKLTLARAAELADGRVHLAADALKLGLIDGVKSFDEVIAGVVAASRNQAGRSSTSGRASAPRSGVTTQIVVPLNVDEAPTAESEAQGADSEANSSPAKERTMSATTDKPADKTGTPAGGTPDAGKQPTAGADSPKIEGATLLSQEPEKVSTTQLKQAFPKSTADFRENCVERGMTMEQASRAYAAELESKNDALAKENAEKDKALKTAASAAKPEGVKPLNEAPGAGKGGGDNGGGARSSEDNIASRGTGTPGQSEQAFMAIVQTNIKAGKSREAAYSLAVRDNKELHQEYLAEYNARHGRRKR